MIAIPAPMLASEGGKPFTSPDWIYEMGLPLVERKVWLQRSLQTMLGVQSLGGKTSLDIGSGSALFSLAALRMGAKVHSFERQPQHPTLRAPSRGHPRCSSNPAVQKAAG